jgi:DNA adenine methylase
MLMGPLTPPLKWHGGKHYLADAVLELMPRHLYYVEPYFGGGQVFFARDPKDERYWWDGLTSDGRKADGVGEVVNDLNKDLMNFYAVLKDPALFPALQRRLELTRCDESEWEASRERLANPDGDPVERAADLFTLCRQSISARMTHFAPSEKGRLRGGREGGVNAWWGAVDGLGTAHERLKGVKTYCRPAVDVIRMMDRESTLFYCDPPYVHGTRTAKKVYDSEMSDGGHKELLDVLLAAKGKVILSGYANEMYDRALAGWSRHEVDVPNNAAGGKAKRRMTEVLWCNF